MSHSTEVIERVAAQGAKQMRSYVASRVRALSRICESPIELALGAALLTIWDMESNAKGPPWRRGGLMLASDNPEEYGIYVRSNDDVLSPQYKASGFRIDFLLMHHLGDGHYWRAGIECDGHEFHDKTKEQAARDKSRDRIISSDNITMFRFTGSEIYKDAFECASEIILAADNANEAYTLRDMPKDWP